MENRAGEFVVEAIRGKREDKGSTYFFIKWLGYPDYENTWEPLEHLSGCRALVEAYLRDHETAEAAKGKKTTINKRESQSAKGSTSKSKSQTKRRKTEGVVKKKGKGKAKIEDENSMESEDGFEYNEAVALEKTRQYIEFDVATKLPRDRSPKRLVHVTVIDGKITYLVQWKKDGCPDDDDVKETVKAENTSMVDASIFRFQYPQMIIKFYESRLLRIEPISDELLAERACAALVSAKEKTGNVEANNYDESDDEEIVKDQPNEQNNNPIDKFGLPMNLDTSSSSSSSDTEVSDADFA